MAPSKELSNVGYDMLRAAVNAARQFQCRSVKALKERLLMTFPGQETAVDEAIEYWAASVRERHPNCVTSN
jgi:hypothetical protein